MTEVLITIDTELSAGRQAHGLSIEENIRQSFLGTVDGGAFGAPWLMEQMDRRGIKGVFFVDPMPGLVHGRHVVEQMVEPLLKRGHDVQLHIHTEWLEWAKESPVDGRRGGNIKDFALADQIALLGWARDALMQAGAPAPTAFRAGNFGANMDTLAALAALGLLWDSSYNADYAGRGCDIVAPGDPIDPYRQGALWEMPVAGIFDAPGRFRPAQVCAMSAAEMRAGLNHAAASGAHSFCVVTHSFEMLSRDRSRPNFTMMSRFGALCDAIAHHPRLIAADYRTVTAPTEWHRQPERLSPSRTRTWSRMAGQALANWRYEGQLRPA